MRNLNGYEGGVSRNDRASALSEDENTPGGRPPPALRATREGVAAALGRLAREDAVAVPLLAPAACRSLIAASADLAFRRAKPVVGEGARAVHQDFDICLAIPEGHRLWHLASAFERLTAAALAGMATPPLAEFRVNDVVMQRYPPGARGITPHRDHVRYRGLVAILQLSGDGRFCVCADRAGSGARAISAGPGDAILMRAPGFAGRRDRPFHFLDGITAERCSFGMRWERERPKAVIVPDCARPLPEKSPAEDST